MFLTLCILRYLIKTFKYAKCLNNKRTNNQCDCISQLFFFFLVNVGVSWRHFLLSVQSKWSKYHCWWLHQWTGVNSLLKNKIGYFCIFLQYKNKGDEMYSTSIVTHRVKRQMSVSEILRNSLILYWSYAWLFHSWAITVQFFFVVLINRSSCKNFFLLLGQV